MSVSATSRPYSPAELRADTLIHVLGVAFALIAGPVLIIIAERAGGGARLASVCVYSATMLAMFGFSAAYNMAVEHPARALLQRLDHGAIFLKIAGTYTPFAAVSLASGSGAALMLGVWTVALIGFLVKLTAPRRFDYAAIPIYLALGWAIILVGDEAAETLSPTSFQLLVTGGVLYTVGVPFHLWSGLRYQNAIWHAFVLAATACMYGAIVLEVAR